MSRINKLKQFLEDHKIDAIIINDPTNLFYLTGLSLSAGNLVVSRSKTHLFVDGRYLILAKEKNPCPVSLNSEEELKDFFSPNAKIGFDGGYFTYETWEAWQRRVEKWKKGNSLVSIDLKTLRLIKDASEIAIMKKAADLTKKGFQHLQSLLKEGVSEIELANEFTCYCLKHGASKTSFDPLIAFGVNTAYPHHRSDKTTLKKNDLVYMDLGVVLDNYCSDMTRPFFFGEKDPKLALIYDTVLKAQKKALSLCKPNTLTSALDQAAREVMAEAKLEEYFAHSLGHGVGLQIHEYPKIKWDVNKHLPLQEGMVITIEPGIYVEALGGVRYEDTIVITKDGHENFYA
jgi:Xaa-Pro aminopeptidase